MARNRKLTGAELRQKVRATLQKAPKTVLPVSPPTKCFELGETLDDGSVYIGQWAPTDNSGRSLGKTFNLFAAPTDLISTDDHERRHLVFDDTMWFLTEMPENTGFNHKGNGGTPADVLYEALKSGTYNGEWFIPTYGILENHLHPNKDIEPLRGSFESDPHDGRKFHVYLSCTGSGDNKVRDMDFTDGRTSQSAKTVRRNVRLVRALPCP